MLDLRYLAVSLVIVTFMLVTVGHVANYAGSFEVEGYRWLGLPYALAVDAAIVVSAWLTRWDKTRPVAIIGYIGFALASGAMNVAAIRPWTYPWPDFIFSFVYALFPTGAIVLLGLLARDAEKVAESTKVRGVLAKVGKRISKKLDLPVESAQPDSIAETEQESKPTFRSDKEYVSWLHQTQPELTPKQIKERVGCSASTVSRGWNNGHNHDG